MTSKQIIVFSGPPSVKDILSTWEDQNVPQDDDDSTLPMFEIDPQQRTLGVAWRRLIDPDDPSTQELAETAVELQSPEDLLLERSLRMFTESDDEEDEMDIGDSEEYSEISVSQVSTPFFAGYDFDINEITELEDIPPAEIVTKNPLRKYSIIVAITEISPCQLVTTKYGRLIRLVKLVVADQTRSELGIACWEHMATFAQSLRADDIVYFRGASPHPQTNIDLGLTEFRGTISAGTRRRTRATILYRCRRLSREDDALRPSLDLTDQQTRFVRRLKDWVVRRGWLVRDVPPALETQDS